ncbi:H-NS family nucleoid-associated regulatory protein [Falsirhodobacter sp. alg1]|uniref:H-NS histone family protein n=1 Tax=Falsirhodobacter sp. alg1 TaxID=1472418 RepID=UPI000786D329|nr:H-NS histone family protein [Falsirhodobacter sp. alg1]
MDLNELSLKELKDLKNELDRTIANYEDRKKREAAQKLEAEARELGFSLQELCEMAQPRKRAPATVKFANPDDPNETWSGRGRKPRWFTDAIAAGKTRDEMSV